MSKTNLYVEYGSRLQAINEKLDSLRKSYNAMEKKGLSKLFESSADKKTKKELANAIDEAEKEKACIKNAIVNIALS